MRSLPALAHEVIEEELAMLLVLVEVVGVSTTENTGTSVSSCNFEVVVR